ncbi:NYN domain-containing protein [Micrococcus endophyticus]
MGRRADAPAGPGRAVVVPTTMSSPAPASAPVHTPAPAPATSSAPAGSLGQVSESTTYLLVDGENIDATLGTSILQRRPQPDERPRWNRLLSFMGEHWDQPVKGLFFLAIDGDIPVPFVQALTAIGYKPIMLRGAGKVVDIGIQKTMEALQERDDDVVLVSHDADFAPQLTDLAATPDRRTAIIGFEEFLSHELRRIPDVEFFDLEYGVGSFDTPLRRLRVIDIDEFDPLEFL